MAILRIGTGPRMSKAVVHNGTIYLAGQVADNGGTVKEQTAEIVAKIDALLKEAGTDKSRILSATVWLADVARFAEMNSVWDAWVPQGNTPARACVEAKLASPAYLVEIAVIAAV